MLCSLLGSCPQAFLLKAHFLCNKKDMADLEKPPWQASTGLPGLFSSHGGPFPLLRSGCLPPDPGGGRCTKGRWACVCKVRTPASRHQGFLLIPSCSRPCVSSTHSPLPHVVMLCSNWSKTLGARPGTKGRLWATCSARAERKWTPMRVPWLLSPTFRQNTSLVLHTHDVCLISWRDKCGLPMSYYEFHSFVEKKGKQTINLVWFWFSITCWIWEFSIPFMSIYLLILHFQRAHPPPFFQKACSSRSEGSRGVQGRTCSRLLVLCGGGCVQFTPAHSAPVPGDQQ